VNDYSDEELMNLAINGDSRAFEELFRRYKRRLFGFFYSLALNTEEARDCVQETFLRLWQNRIQFAHKGRFSAYMFQIARNHFLDKKRSQKSHIELQHISDSEPAESFHQVSLSGNGYGEAVLNEIRSAVSNAMTHLPEIQRIVYVLSEEQGMSYKEIAEILECPVGTVSSRKVEAVRKLRIMLQPLRDELFGKNPLPGAPGVGKKNNEVNK